MTTFTFDSLETKTVPELRNMCVNELEIPGMTKKRKDVIITAILKKYGEADSPIIKETVTDKTLEVAQEEKNPLEGKTMTELIELCKEYNIPGVAKSSKATIIEVLTALMNNVDVEEEKDLGDIVGLESELTSVLTDDYNRTIKTTIKISSGAASGSFPVVGRTVGEVGEFLREVLNVDRMSEGVVNGKKVDDNYVLTSSDSLEFLKPSGKKGSK